MKIYKAKNPKYKEYKRERKVGEGTFAVVYTGTAQPTDSLQEEKIAIKKIKQGFEDGLDVSAIREIKYLKLVSHVNVVKIIDVITEENQLHLVLEYLTCDLEMIIKNKNILFSSGDIKSWMIMLLEGVNAIHRLFIIHRDLKPNNLLISQEGVLKICDFGLSRTFGDPNCVMTSNTVTRWYRAPELLLGCKQYGPFVDCIFF
jgi:cyclin-dependent kinase 7